MSSLLSAKIKETPAPQSCAVAFWSGSVLGVWGPAARSSTATVAMQGNDACRARINSDLQTEFGV